VGDGALDFAGPAGGAFQRVEGDFFHLCASPFFAGMGGTGCAGASMFAGRRTGVKRIEGRMDGVWKAGLLDFFNA
jgi:hypothetical protein